MIVVANSNIFGKKMKYLRESHGLSLSEMADLIHIDAHKLNLLEQGLGFEIDGKSLLAVYRTFPVDQEHFFDQLIDNR